MTHCARREHIRSHVSDHQLVDAEHLWVHHQLHDEVVVASREHLLVVVAAASAASQLVASHWCKQAGILQAAGSEDARSCSQRTARKSAC